MNKLCQKSIEAAANIGQFYLRKNNGDYEKTADEIMRLCITDVSVAEDVVTVTTKRPGLLIGMRGERVGQLEDFLNQKIKIVETEGSAVDYLIPEPPWEYTEDYGPDMFEDWIETEDDYRYMDDNFKL